MIISVAFLIFLWYNSVKERRVANVFQQQIGTTIVEVSHKRIEEPRQSVYFNHIHNHCELLLFVCGEANYNIDGQIYKPQPYDLLFIPAATYHYLIPISSHPYENYVVGIDPSEIPKAHYEKLFSPPLMINIKEDAEFRGFFKRLDRYRETFSDEDFDRTAKALILELVTYCTYQKDNMHFVHSGSMAHIDEIIRYILEHLEEKLDAERIAKHFFLSESYVQNLFSQNMHIGLKKYIMQKKIYAARTDMIQGLSPNAACEKYGFGDYSIFFRVYKKTFGSSPRTVERLK